MRPHVCSLADQFGIGTVYTRAGHSPRMGLAADFMTRSGDALAAHVIANHGQYDVEYVIWKQRIAAAYTGWQWRAMEDRGSATANHFDHVHVTFLPA